ncbi:MAG: hypothetical protein HGA35_01145, partial [Erysipelotrichaceae bacterium]|nr:hypothetical protein [Erysipelotrichaceae bacterium]
VKQLEKYSLKRLLVVATRLTIQSDIYAKTIESILPNVKVDSVALPELVQKIEGLDTEVNITNYIDSCLSKSNLDCDGLILGCTHYPLVESSFTNLFKHRIIDSIGVMVDLFKDKLLEEGNSQCFTTKDAGYAKHQVHQLFQIEEDFTKIEV